MDQAARYLKFAKETGQDVSPKEFSDLIESCNKNNFSRSYLRDILVPNSDNATWFQKHRLHLGGFIILVSIALSILYNFTKENGKVTATLTRDSLELTTIYSGNDALIISGVNLSGN